MTRPAIEGARTIFAACGAAVADAFERVGLSRPGKTYKQPSSLYKTPHKPGFIGGYNWPSLVVGLFVLFASNVVATQFVAWQ